MCSVSCLRCHGRHFLWIRRHGVCDPEIPAGWSGIFIASQDAYAEIAAMYGGLEIAIGSILLASAFIKEYLKAGLWLLFVIISYIGAARAFTVFRELDSKFEVAGSHWHRDDLELYGLHLGCLGL